MFEACFQGLFAVFHWPAIGFLIFGVLIGIWLGAVPGLNGITGLVLLLPFTFSMPPVHAFALLLGMFSVTSTGDTISTILLGIPGTVAAQATLLDGYPLAKKGQAARAFGAAFTVSAYGGIFGALVLAASLPILLPVILLFTSSEMFMLAVLGLSMVGSLAGRSVAKGLTVAAFGVLLAMVGSAPTLSIPRYYFGIDYLLDGIPLVPLVLGFFGLPELLELAVSDTSISRVPEQTDHQNGLMQGVRDVFTHWWLATKSAIIGTYIGMMPGLGSSVVDWVAYSHAVQSAKDSSQFGQGDIRGVIAPEAANHAIRGGALIPMVAFGVPGSLGTAILLGALLIQGLKPGPEMLTTQLPLTFSIIWSIVLANILASALLMVAVKQITRVAFLPGHLIIPGVILFVFMGAWLGASNLGDWIVCLAAGIFGLIMKRSGWPRPPLVLALVLGPIMESSFHISVIGHQGYDWLARPIVILIMLLIVLTIGFNVHRTAKNKRTGRALPTAGEGMEQSPLISIPMSALLFVTFAAAIPIAMQWPPSVSQFPIVASVTGLISVSFALFEDQAAVRKVIAEHEGLQNAWKVASRAALLDKSALFFAYLIAMLLLTLVVGQKLAIPAYMFAYMITWGRYGWKPSLLYAFAGWIMLVVFYDQIMHLFWYPSWLYQVLPPLLPGWLPKWLFI